MTHPQTPPVPVPVLLANPAVPRSLGRGGALLAIACLLAHLPVIASHFAAAPVTSVAMSIVSLACVPCARKLWRAPTAQDSATAATLAVAMVALHVYLGLSMMTAITPTSTDMPKAMHLHSEMNTGAQNAHATAPTFGVHHFEMRGGVEVIFYLATAMAGVQILLNIVTIALSVRQAKTASSVPGESAKLMVATST